MIALLRQIFVKTAFRNGSAVKNPPAMQETRVRSLGRENPLKEETEWENTRSSVLAWKKKNPWTEEPGGLELDTTE